MNVILNLVAKVLFFLSITFCAFGLGQSDFHLLFPVYALCFLIYILVIWKVRDTRQVQHWLVIGILCRALLIFAFPQLSDDIYRFFWDGQLSLHGIHPFLHTPAQIPLDRLPGSLDTTVFNHLNSQEYFSVYPPLSQLFFAAAAWIAGSDLQSFSITLKTFFFLFETGTIYYLFRYLKASGKGLSTILLYVLNPLIILEIMGNLHFEGLMIFFLSFGLYKLYKRQWIIGGLSLAFSVLSKLVPLIAIPFLWIYAGTKHWFRIVIPFTLILLLGFLPLLNAELLQNFQSSLDLYFRTFEFNGSFYYVLRWFGYQLVGYNWIHVIGPSLAVVIILILFLIAGKQKKRSFSALMKALVYAFTIYLLGSTTVHPWYLCIPVLLCTYTVIRFPLMWSFLIYISYAAYAQPEVVENPWMLWLEYGLLALFIFVEWLSGRNKKTGGSLQDQPVSVP